MNGQSWLAARRNRVLVLLAAMVIVLLLVSRVRGILSPFILAGVITYVLEPPVRWLERRGLPRVVSIILIYLLVIGGAALLVAWIIPSALAQLYGLSQNLPSYTRQVQDLVVGLQHFYARLALPESVRSMLDQSLVNAEAGLLKVIGAMITAILGAIAWIPSLILAPFLAFYALKDLQAIRAGVINCLPRESRTEIIGLLAAIDAVLARFLRGQVILSAIVGTAFALGLRMLGIPFWVIIGVFAAFAEVIPYFGPVIGATPAVAIALTRSPALAIKVVILFTIIQELENTVLAPKIMGDSIGLHPLWVFFAILAGGELAGFWGLLLAVPTAGILKVLLSFGVGKMAATATPEPGAPGAGPGSPASGTGPPQAPRAGENESGGVAPH